MPPVGVLDPMRSEAPGSIWCSAVSPCPVIRSACMLKVFDASNADEIGEYRVARIAQDDFSLPHALVAYKRHWREPPGSFRQLA